MQLSRMGVGGGLGELVEGDMERRGDDGESSEDYDSDIDGQSLLSRAV